MGVTTHQVLWGGVSTWSHCSLSSEKFCILQGVLQDTTVFPSCCPSALHLVLSDSRGWCWACPQPTPPRLTAAENLCNWGPPGIQVPLGPAMAGTSHTSWLCVWSGLALHVTQDLAGMAVLSPLCHLLVPGRPSSWCLPSDIPALSLPETRPRGWVGWGGDLGAHLSRRAGPGQGAGTIGLTDVVPRPRALATLTRPRGHQHEREPCSDGGREHLPLGPWNFLEAHL